MKLRLPPALAVGVALVFLSVDVQAQSPAPSRGTAEQGRPRETRPTPDPLKLPNLPQVPVQVLEAWASATQKIEKMDGEVRRISYENVFQVEKHSEGRFWYEAPDKGRIDLEGLTFKENAKGNRFPLAPGDTEEWVCDGLRIHQIDRERKECNIFPIPKDAQGANIMHGPLPFLFGMPPEIAQKRYWLFLKDHDDEKAQILAYPKWSADRQNYQYAAVILDKKTYLPIAVKLKEPSGNGDTIYTFGKVKVNRGANFFFKKDPFTPDLRGLSTILHDQQQRATAKPNPNPNPGAQPRPQPPQPGTMPSLVGLHGRDVVALCTKLGVKPRFLRGAPAANEQLKHRVYKQRPEQNQPLEKGQEIEVVLYDEPGAATKN